MTTVVVFDTKSYDEISLRQEADAVRIDWRFHPFRLTAETAVGAEGASAVCAFVNDRLDRACLDVLANLGVAHVALRCAGFNQVDMDAARALGLRVTRVPAYSPHAVAEHSVALLMTLNRKVHRAFNRVREQDFSLHGLVGFDLFGKTVGIVGTGRIGRIAAALFKGFGCEVVVYDAFEDVVWADSLGVRYAVLDELIRHSDVISLYVPLTPETHYLVNDESLARMKPGAYLINTSRGKLVDTKALIRALKAGRLGGVALDVYEEEEGVFFEDLSDAVLHDDELARLLSFPNVLVTAHQAFLTREALSEIARVTVANVLRLADGDQPLAETEV